MCSDGERATLASSGNGKLRQWLIEQVDTEKYPGLVWEDEEKTVFRIPWKHAGKQDYNRDEDAALFKVRENHYNRDGEHSYCSKRVERSDGDLILF